METLGYVLLAAVTVAALYLYVAEEMTRRRRPRPVALEETDAPAAPGGPQDAPSVALVPRGPSWRTERSRQPEEMLRHVFFMGNVSEGFVIPVHMKNVIGVELMRCNLPRGEYVVNDGNRFLDLRATGASAGTEGVFTVSLDVGDGYTAKTFITALQQRVRATSNYFEDFSLAIDLRQSRAVSTNGNPFELLFASGPNAHRSMYVELGFGNAADAVSAGADNRITSDFRVDLSGVRFLEFTTEELGTVGHQDGVLAQIAMGPVSPLVEFSETNPRQIMRRFSNPMHIRTLTMSIRSLRQGQSVLQPYEFHGLFFQITLAVFVLKHKIPFESIIDEKTN